MSVCLSVCLSVFSLLRYPLNVFLPSLPEVGCPKFLKIRNPWGKVMERSGFRFKHFCLEIAAQKKFIFLLILRYKTCWKPRFPMDERPLVKGYIANFGISLEVFELLRFGWFFSVFQKAWVLAILGPPYRSIGATIRIGREMLCLYAGFFLYFFFFIIWHFLDFLDFWDLFLISHFFWLFLKLLRLLL